MNPPGYRFEASQATYFLIGANVAVYAIEILIGQEAAFYHLSLIPILLRTGRNAHTLLTSVYLHADPLHLFMNMLALWIFGPGCEREMGGRNFLIFYNSAGVAGSAAHVLAYPLSHVPVMGASGAVFGIMAAFAVLFPLRPILVFMVIPMVLPAALWAALYFLIEVVYEFSGLNPYVAHMAHIGGFAAGLAFAFLYRRFSRARKGSGVKIIWVEG
ncbi:MAG: rhomboid family intramembrane serine protease [Candidatus Brockarchaeota archaeon]|nr:rhomboid family intramembrane serine protease [Candidatus Brockarchaeota archaeon]